MFVKSLGVGHCSCRTSVPVLCTSPGLGFWLKFRCGLIVTFPPSFTLIWLFPLKLRQLLLESQSQLDEAKSEAQKQSDELALVG